MEILRILDILTGKRRISSSYSNILVAELKRSVYDIYDGFPYPCKVGHAFIRPILLTSKGVTSMSASPRTTLTFSQSIDGAIGLRDGKQLILSGSESTIMTHKLRAAHDAILVGIGTVLNDNPSLNVRFPQVLPKEQQPIPIVLDPKLRIPPDCHLISRCGKDPDAQPPIIVHLAGVSPDPSLDYVQYLPIKSFDEWQILEEIRRKCPAIRTIMIEAPIFVGESGAKPVFNISGAPPGFELAKTKLYGNDYVVYYASKSKTGDFIDL